MFKRIKKCFITVLAVIFGFASIPMHALYNVTDEECNTFLELCEKFSDNEELNTMKNMIDRLKCLYECLNDSEFGKCDYLLGDIERCHQNEKLVFYKIYKRIQDNKNDEVFEEKYDYKTCTNIFDKVDIELDLIMSFVYTYLNSSIYM